MKVAVGWAFCPWRREDYATVAPRAIVLCFLLLLLVGLGSCAAGPAPRALGPLNSRFSDRQPALSGDGRYLALMTDRNTQQELALYDLQTQQFIALPGVNRRDRLIESPSLSRSARYLVFLASERGRADVQIYDRLQRRGEILTLGYPGVIRNPSISPDGRYVAFESARRGEWNIEILDRGPGAGLDGPSGAAGQTAPVPGLPTPR